MTADCLVETSGHEKAALMVVSSAISMAAELEFVSVEPMVVALAAYLV